MTADIEGVEDRGEPTSLMEPLLIATDSRHRPALPILPWSLRRGAPGSVGPCPRPCAARSPTS